jgi:hypothetical protein
MPLGKRAATAMAASISAEMRKSGIGRTAESGQIGTLLTVS